ncbi:TPA: hypothetical protein ACGHB3_004035, partial [Acinetobacter baumannii]
TKGCLIANFATVPFQLQFRRLKTNACMAQKQSREGANKRGNSSRLTQSFHFFLFEPFFLP